MHLRFGYCFATDCGIVFDISSLERISIQLRYLSIFHYLNPTDSQIFRFSLDGQIFSILKRQNIISIQLSNMEPTVESLIPNIYASKSIVIPSFSLTRTSRNCSSSDNAYLLFTDIGHIGKATRKKFSIGKCCHLFKVSFIVDNILNA